jgi:hypothetical protein
MTMSPQLVRRVIVVGSVAGAVGAEGNVMSSARGVPGLAQTMGAAVPLAVELGDALGEALDEALSVGVASSEVSRLASETPTMAAMITTATAIPMPIWRRRCEP